MAMTIGSCAVSIDGNGNPTYSGSGLALALLKGRVAVLIPRVRASVAADGADPASTWEYINSAATDMSATALADATAIVQHIQANAVAHVTTQSLGVTPTPNNAGTAIVPPGSPVDVPIQ